MAHAEICPVCNGSGQLNPMGQDSSTVVPQSQNCHGCSGKGWVEIGNTVSGMWVWPPGPEKLPPEPYYPMITWHYQHEVGL